MKKKHNKSIILRLLVLAVCAYFVVTLSGLWSDLNKSQKQLNELKLQYEAEKNDVEELKALLESDSQKQMIEKAARERLGYIYSDEQVFIDISGN